MRMCIHKNDVGIIVDLFSRILYMNIYIYYMDIRINVGKGSCVGPWGNLFPGLSATIVWKYGEGWSYIVERTKVEIDDDKDEELHKLLQ
jgi:hypothetical protein